MSDVRLDPQRYFELIDADTERLLAMGERGLVQPVPSCPGWTVSDVVSHVAAVYEHKVRLMADNAWPQPWPPGDFQEREREPLRFLEQAKAHLFEEFAAHTLTEETTTFSPDDHTIGFWVRRMAQEVAVHRYDAELAHADTTPIPPDEAVDGIDEVLKVSLEVDADEGVTTEHPRRCSVAVEAAANRWLCRLDEHSVSVTPGDPAGADAVVTGEPEAVYLWLWGRTADDSVQRLGDGESLAAFRGRLVESTQ